MYDNIDFSKDMDEPTQNPQILSCKYCNSYISYYTEL